MNQSHVGSPPLTLNLFGSIEVRVHGIPLRRLHSRKGLWLLALLTLRQGKPVERDWLVGTLWPDSSQSQALAYLRQSLTELRHALGTEAVRLQSPTRQTLALDLAGAEVDVLTFDVGIQQAEPFALQRAVEVYKGPFLEDCNEEWALLERTNREQSYLSALQALAGDALAQGDLDTAIQRSRRIIGVDPLQEGAQRTLIQALASAGDYGAATQVYRDLRLFLHRELNAEPDPQTTALYNKLRARTRQKALAVREVATSPSPPRRLPRPLTDLLGRDGEVIEIAARLRQRRLVTLTGIGGVGKTRLAIAVAEVLVEEYTDGAWFVDLAGVSDANLVVQSVATVLGVHEEPGVSLQEALVSFLRPRLLVLVLDNCEHLLPTCASLAEDLLHSGSGVRVLATSRQALGITGEVDWQVPPLPFPELVHLPTEATRLLAEVSECASAQLFVERAESVQKTFALTAHNALAIAQICQRLDGIPLALELAAGNVKVLPVEQIARRLDDVFQLLIRGSRTALPRQQTLRATMDWSYALLNDTEKALLCGLSVFAGGWTLQAAEEVCSGASRTAEESVSSREVLQVLTHLTDKSLVVSEERAGEARYRLLETVRQYARERLGKSGATDAWRIAHRDYFLRLAEDAQEKLGGPEQKMWVQHLETEHDNLRAALDFCLTTSKGVEVGLQLAAALQQFWWTHGHLSEGRYCLETALNRPDAQEPTPTRARALSGAGSLALMQGDYVGARGWYEKSLALGQALEDKQGVARVLGNLGMVADRQGDYAAARSYFEASLTMKREFGDKRGIANTLLGLGNVAMEQSDYVTARLLSEESLALGQELEDKRCIARSLTNLGNIAHLQGDYTVAHPLYEASLAIQRDLGDQRGVARSLNNLGNVATAEGNFAAARSLFEESLELQRELGDREGIAYSLCNLGSLLGKQGEYSAAHACLRECLTTCQDLGEKWAVAYALEGCAEMAYRQQQTERSIQVYAAAHALRVTHGSPLPPNECQEYDRHVAALREAVGENRFREAWAKGQVKTLEQAIAYALEERPT